MDEKKQGRPRAKGESRGKKIAKVSTRSTLPKSAAGNVTHSLDAARGVLKEVPVYTDLAQPAAKEAGAGIALLTTVFTSAIFSLAMWMTVGPDGMTVKESFQRRMRSKLQSLDPESITPPQPRLAGPLLAHYPFVAEDNELRELFENLLVTSMSQGGNAHPAFVEILKQITPDEARMIQYLHQFVASHSDHEVDLPYIEFHAYDKGGLAHQNVGFVSNLDLLDSLLEPGDAMISIANLRRQRIIRVTTSMTHKSHGFYEELEKSQFTADVRKDVLADDPTREFRLVRGLMTIEPIGAAFIRACVRGRGAAR